MGKKVIIAAAVLFIVGLIFFEVPLSGEPTLKDAIDGKIYITIAPLSLIGRLIPLLQRLTANQMFLIGFSLLLPSFIIIKKRGYKLFPLILLITGFSGMALDFLFGWEFKIPSLQFRYYFFILIWISFNLWIKDKNFFYASAIGAFLWDLSSAIWGLSQNMAAVPVPYCGTYDSGVCPIYVPMALDSSAIITLFILWLKGVFPKPI